MEVWSVWKSCWLDVEALLAQARSQNQPTAGLMRQACTKAAEGGGGTGDKGTHQTSPRSP